MFRNLVSFYDLNSIMHLLGILPHARPLRGLVTAELAVQPLVLPGLEVGHHRGGRQLDILLMLIIVIMREYYVKFKELQYLVFKGGLLQSFQRGIN